MIQDYKLLKTVKLDPNHTFLSGMKEDLDCKQPTTSKTWMHLLRDLQVLLVLEDNPPVLHLDNQIYTNLGRQQYTMWHWFQTTLVQEKKRIKPHLTKECTRHNNNNSSTQDTNSLTIRMTLLEKENMNKSETQKYQRKLILEPRRSIGNKSRKHHRKKNSQKKKLRTRKDTIKRRNITQRRSRTARRDQGNTRGDHTHPTLQKKCQSLHPHHHQETRKRLRGSKRQKISHLVSLNIQDLLIRRKARNQNKTRKMIRRVNQKQRS